MRTNTVKQALREGRATVGSWLTLPDPVAALQMTTVGFDWLTIDLEHSSTDYQTAAIMCQLIAHAGSTPIVRVPWNTNENVKHALDSGAFGVIFPMQSSRADVEQAVAWAKYPPQGLRGYGPTLAVIGFETDARTYFEHANDETLVIVQIEQVEAVDALDDILSVPGVDVAFIGPNDLSASMGLSPFESHGDPRFIETVAHIRERAEAHGVAPGIYAPTPQIGRQRLDEGFRFVGVGDEAGHMLSGARAALAQLR
ncbi:2-dehydro-3-deoxyglucarate aldolase [bacterium]|nr:2-dehydro-3-deoxyglucarate aldolase [bacterium]